MIDSNAGSVPEFELTKRMQQMAEPVINKLADTYLSAEERAVAVHTPAVADAKPTREELADAATEQDALSVDPKLLRDYRAIVARSSSAP